MHYKGLETDSLYKLNELSDNNVGVKYQLDK